MKLNFKKNSAFIVAEIGNNHQGDFKTAKLLVDAAITSGANCAKFQLRTMDKLYNKNDTICIEGRSAGSAAGFITT